MFEANERRQQQQAALRSAQEALWDMMLLISDDELVWASDIEPGESPDNISEGRYWRLTCNHAASSYGMPVLVDGMGNAYGPGDFIATEPGSELEWIREPARMRVACLASRQGLRDHPLIRRFLNL